MSANQQNAEKLLFALGKSSVGTVLVAQSPRGLCAVFLGGNPEQLVKSLQQQFPLNKIRSDTMRLTRLLSQVIDFIEHPHIQSNFRLDLQGTEFQKMVWRALQQIPPGATMTYSELARELGRPTAVRAIANACAANKLAVIIPCHRVIRTDGAMAGYRWGVARKRELIAREAQQQCNQPRAGIV